MVFNCSAIQSVTLAGTGYSVEMVLNKSYVQSTEV